jgi:hypothetical protein
VVAAHQLEALNFEVDAVGAFRQGRELISAVDSAEDTARDTATFRECGHEHARYRSSRDVDHTPNQPR